MKLIPISLLLLFSFILQYIFTMKQIRSFNKYYTKLRQKGKVAIGKKKGLFRAGAIIMFALDNHNVIIEGAVMQGITVIARFKNYSLFNNMKIEDITKEICIKKRISKSITSALLDSVETFKKVQKGEKIEIPKSIFGKIVDKIN